MLSELLKKTINGLPLLIPYFSGTNSLEKDVESVGAFISSAMPVKFSALVRLGNRAGPIFRAASAWRPDNKEYDRKTAALLENATQDFLTLLGDEDTVESPLLNRMLGFPEEEPTLLFAVRYAGLLSGLLFVQRESDDWLEEERQILLSLSGLMGAALSSRTNLEDEELCSFVFNKVLDGMNASLYITDVDTDRIIFMNQTMKDAFKIKNPEGCICWKVLQQGMDKRCDFCPVDQLKKSGEDTPTLEWEELNTVTRRCYKNYDSLIRWVDGSVVHLQQSIDMTDLKFANTDELTHLMTRRAGKDALRTAMERAKEQKRVLTVCLYDVNLLKETNDIYGHAAGDQMISSIANAVNSVLQNGEYAFRLSGDEFVVVFLSGKNSAKLRIQKALDKLQNEHTAHEASFCFGLAEILPGQPITLEEALLIADERMYEQKRHFHILRNEHRQKNVSAPGTSKEFTYDANRLYEALVQSTDDYMYICNMKTGIFRYSPAMVEEFGLPGEIIENAAAIWGAKVHEDDKAAFLESNQEITDGRTTEHCVEYRAKNKKGEWVWLRCRGHLEIDENGESVLFAGFITNRNKKNRLDHLTGLFNKLEFENHVRRLIGEEPDSQFSIMVLGIDDLKHVNDLYDRAFGDEVIRLTAQRIQSMLAEDMALYRLDGDEFGVVARGHGREEMKAFYRKMQHAFEGQQEYKNKKYYCALSAGCLLYPQDADSYANLLKYAGYSLAYAKSSGKKRCVFFSQDILACRYRDLEMVELLRESVENDFEGFSLRFQPLVEASTGKLIGAEALTRWYCEKFGEISPVIFIPLLEQTGLIIPVGEWIFRTAVRTCRTWNMCRPGFEVSINLSYVQVEGADFVSYMKQTLQDEGYPPNNLVVELTESTFVKESRRVQEIFSDIRKMGVSIAMDDFGTGYSTLGMLKEMPADIVKIDKTFIRDIQTSNFDVIFIRFVVELCHDVGIKVCLEGVETKDEYEIVSKMGLDFIQGYLFGRPLEEQEFCSRHLTGSTVSQMGGSAFEKE